MTDRSRDRPIRSEEETAKKQFLALAPGWLDQDSVKSKIKECMVGIRFPAGDGSEAFEVESVAVNGTNGVTIRVKGKTESFEVPWERIGWVTQSSGNLWQSMSAP